MPPLAERNGAQSFAFLSRKPPSKADFRRVTMLWTIVAVLVVLWLLGFVGGIGGGLIHALLVLAGIVLVFQLISGRRIA